MGHSRPVPLIEQRAITVHDVFELPRLVDAGLRVAAGADALSREVRWVHVGEIADIARFLSGGELLLTAGAGIGHAASDQAHYVDALIQAGASALVLELGRHFRTLPAPIRQRANAAGLPVATLKREVPFSEVMREVHAWLIGRRYAVQSRVERMAIELNDLLLSGGSTSQIVHRVSTLTGKAVCLEDAAHQLVEYSGAPELIERLVDDWNSHSRFGHRTPNETRDGHHCAWSSIVLRDEQWGRLHIIGGDQSVDDVDVLAAQRASASLGLALLTFRHNTRLAEETRADLLAEVARRAPEDADTFLRQVRALGADFRDRDLVAVATTSGQADISVVASTLVSELNARHLPVLSSVGEREHRALIGVSADEDPVELVRQAAVQAMSDRDVDGLVIGISRPAGIATIPRAFHEANECLRFGRVSNSRGVLLYSDLGLHLLLASQVDGPELATFVETELGALLDHDAGLRSPLLPTLRALLAHDGNRAEAARALHLERRSLYYRIERIEKILGRSLNDHDVKLGLSVALRALSLVEDRTAMLRRNTR